VELQVIELELLGMASYVVYIGIDEYADPFGLAGQVSGQVRHVAGRAFVADESHPVGSGLLYGADVFGLAHAAYFYYHLIECFF
jgi:hypothetical protein